MRQCYLVLGLDRDVMLAGGGGILGMTRGAKLRIVICQLRLADAAKHLENLADVMDDPEALNNELGPALEAIYDVRKTLRDLERRLLR
jgi:hypothetical protein